MSAVGGQIEHFFPNTVLIKFSKERNGEEGIKKRQETRQEEGEILVVKRSGEGV